MAEDTVRTCAQYISTSREGDTTKHQAKIFHSLVIWGKLRSAIWRITNREKGRVFHTGDICPRTGNPVLEVLHSKPPGSQPLTAGILEAYKGQPPAFIPVDVTN